MIIYVLSYAVLYYIIYHILYRFLVFKDISISYLLFFIVFIQFSFRINRHVIGWIF